MSPDAANPPASVIHSARFIAEAQAIQPDPQLFDGVLGMLDWAAGGDLSIYARDPETHLHLIPSRPGYGCAALVTLVRVESDTHRTLESIYVDPNPVAAGHSLFPA